MYAVTILALLPVSCDFLPDFNPKNSENNTEQKGLPDEYYDLEVLDTNYFYAQDMANRKYYKVQAEIKATGDKCIIWAEKGSGITEERAKTIAGIYDDEIRKKIIDAFGLKNFYNATAKKQFDDILDYANWLVGGNNNKLTILLLDIRDNYKESGKDPTYVAGYFFSGNFWEKGPLRDSRGNTHYSNSKDMIYIDTYPGLEKKPDQTYATFAHELQHLINYTTARHFGKRQMDTWIDEGLSSQAEHIYLGTHPKDRCEWFRDDKNKTISQGNNFFVWDNYDAEPMAILDDYATVYLFFRWLYLQAGNELKTDIFRNMEISGFSDYRIVTEYAKQINPDWENWEVLLRAWFAANYFPKRSYGYTGDTYLQNDIVKVKPIAGQTITLYPGEGVYSLIKTSYIPKSPGSNIRYAGLLSNSLSLSSPHTGEALLTFNISTGDTTKTETGDLTGVAPPSPRTAGTGTPESTGPYVIDARDILGRNWDLPLYETSSSGKR